MKVQGFDGEVLDGMLSSLLDGVSRCVILSSDDLLPHKISLYSGKTSIFCGFLTSKTKHKGVYRYEFSDFLDDLKKSRAPHIQHKMSLGDWLIRESLNGTCIGSFDTELKHWSMDLMSSYERVLDLSEKYGYFFTGDSKTAMPVFMNNNQWLNEVTLDDNFILSFDPYSTSEFVFGKTQHISFDQIKAQYNTSTMGAPASDFERVSNRIMQMSYYQGIENGIKKSFLQSSRLSLISIKTPIRSGYVIDIGEKRYVSVKTEVAFGFQPTYHSECICL